MGRWNFPAAIISHRRGWAGEHARPSPPSASVVSAEPTRVAVVWLPNGQVCKKAPAWVGGEGHERVTPIFWDWEAVGMEGKAKGCDP